MKTKFPVYCLDLETTFPNKENDLLCAKVIKKDCSVVVKLNNICLPKYTKE